MLRATLTSLVAIGTLAISASIAAASPITLMECGPSHGYTYPLEDGLIGAAGTTSEGFVDDGMTGGTLTLIQDDQGFDIITKDALTTFSFRADGAKIFRVNAAPDVWSILVVYPGKDVESFIFHRRSRGGEVAWTQIKFNELSSRASVFVSACQPEAVGRNILADDFVPTPARDDKVRAANNAWVDALHETYKHPVASDAWRKAKAKEKEAFATYLAAKEAQQ